MSAATDLFGTTATPATRPVRVALDGARDMTAMVVGVIPFALAIGTSIGASSVSPAQGLASAAGILAGSAQLATIEMLDTGTAPLVIIVSALLINARILLYGAAIAPWFSGQPLRRRLALAIPVIDQMHFTCTARFERGDLDERGRVAYYTGAAVWLCGAWLTAQAVAIAIGAQMPDSLRLDLAAPLALVGLLARSTGDRPAIGAAVAAAVVAVAFVGVPLHGSTLLATLCGIGAGTALRSRERGGRPLEAEEART